MASLRKRGNVGAVVWGLMFMFGDAGKTGYRNSNDNAVFSNSGQQHACSYTGTGDQFYACNNCEAVTCAMRVNMFNGGYGLMA